MQLNPYLHYNGQCETAFKFYEQCLGGKIMLKMTYGESPMAQKSPPEMLDRIMHIRFEVGGTVLMGADCPPGNYDEPKGFTVSINLADPLEADRIFTALSEKGTITMPIQETFWAARFGMLKDQFGIPWMINCEKKP